MVHLQCQLDWIYGHLGDTSLGITVRGGAVYWRGQIYPVVGGTITKAEREANNEVSARIHLP